MRRLHPLVVLLGLLATVLVALPASAADPVTCPDGQVLVRGRVYDDATDLPLGSLVSVEYYEVDGTPIDGGGTDNHGRFGACWGPGSFTVKFNADGYRPEWWQDAADLASATVVTVPAGAAEPIVLDAYVTPRGRVLAGRVTNLTGRPVFASVGIWRRTATGWRSIDGEGTIGATGRWSYRVPALGQYRVNAFVDHHWARWHRSAARFRDARTVTVGAATTFIDDVNIRVPYCTASAGFCAPPGFFT